MRFIRSSIKKSHLMVGFGRLIATAQRDDWQAAYLDYGSLKRAVHNIAKEVASHNNPDDPGSCSTDLNTSVEEFFRNLHREVEKISLFSLQQQGRLSGAVGSLRYPIMENILFHYDATMFRTAATTPSQLERHMVVGIELLHVLRFIGINSIGVRKILKKFTKVLERAVDKPPSAWNSSSIDGGGDHHHLQQLAHHLKSITALLLSFRNSCLEFQHGGGGEDDDHHLSLFRLQCIVQSSSRLLNNVEFLQRPFWEFLSKQSMIVPGSNLGGMDRDGQETLQWLVQLRPDELLNMTILELEILSKQWPARSFYFRPPSLIELRERPPLPIVELENDDLTNGEQPKESDDDDGRELYWGGVNMTSMILNLTSVLFYTVNYYIVAPTANHYAIKLGADGAFGASLIGASSVSAIFAACFYSFWYTKYNFGSALVFSAACPLVGNLVYAMAISFRSMPMAIAGRLLCGFGSAEVVNRQLISTCVSFSSMTQASALFVTAGALGMSLGPLIAGILDAVTGRDMIVDLPLPLLPAGGVIYNHVTSPGFVMGGIWLVQLIALAVLFKEPVRAQHASITLEQEKKTDFAYPIHSDKQQSSTTQYGSCTVIQNEKQHGSQSLRRSLLELCQLVVSNPGLPVTLLIFGYVELIDEVLISSSSMVVRRYFGWNGDTAGFLIACLGALVLPAHFVVEKASRHFSERRILFRSLGFIFLSLFGILNWPGLVNDIIGAVEESIAEGEEEPAIFSSSDMLTDQREFKYDGRLGPSVYIVFLSLTFMGTIVLEGVDTSIMAKVTPAKLNESFVNAGLLATIVGTFGRVFADGIITFSAFLDKHILVDFVNVLFLPLLLITLAELLLLVGEYEFLV